MLLEFFHRAIEPLEVLAEDPVQVGQLVLQTVGELLQVLELRADALIVLHDVACD